MRTLSAVRIILALLLQVWVSYRPCVGSRDFRVQLGLRDVEAHNFTRSAVSRKRHPTLKRRTTSFKVSKAEICPKDWSKAGTCWVQDVVGQVIDTFVYAATTIRDQVVDMARSLWSNVMARAWELLQKLIRWSVVPTIPGCRIELSIGQLERTVGGLRLENVRISDSMNGIDFKIHSISLQLDMELLTSTFLAHFNPFNVGATRAWPLAVSITSIAIEGISLDAPSFAVLSQTLERIRSHYAAEAARKPEPICDEKKRPPVDNNVLSKLPAVFHRSKSPRIQVAHYVHKLVRLYREELHLLEGQHGLNPQQQTHMKRQISKFEWWDLAYDACRKQKNYANVKHAPIVIVGSIEVPGGAMIEINGHVVQLGAISLESPTDPAFRLRSLLPFLTRSLGLALDPSKLKLPPTVFNPLDIVVEKFSG